MKRRDPRHPAVEGFSRPKAEIIKRWLPADRDSLILEVGSGNGYLTHYLEDLGKVVATDFSLPMLLGNPGSVRLVADAGSLPFNDHAFDMVIEANLLHHVNKPLEVVREMKRVSRDTVVLIEPNRWNPLMLALGLAKKEERKTLLMCRSNLKGLLEQAGLEMVEMVMKGFVTPSRMPLWTVNLLSRFEQPSRFAAYVLAVGRCMG